MTTPAQVVRGFWSWAQALAAELEFMREMHEGPEGGDTLEPSLWKLELWRAAE